MILESYHLESIKVFVCVNPNKNIAL